jgi:hypothetical protein
MRRDAPSLHTRQHPSKMAWAHLGPALKIVEEAKAEKEILDLSQL